MSVLDGFKEVGERTGGKLTMTVMLESVRFPRVFPKFSDVLNTSSCW